jgi:2-succinyl-6-hydroxy-2,4-cyclohexadiene-1-carboxylate synthase
MTRVVLPAGYAMNLEVAGRGEPVVLMHGFTGSARSWGEFGELLAERFTTIAVDLPGHGQTDSPQDIAHYEMTQCAEDVVTALRSLGHHRAYWIGYSMGGRTALHVAAAHRESVRRLVLIGASAGLDCVEDRLARTAADNLLAERIEREGVEAFVDYWERLPLFATQERLPREVREAVRRGRLANTATGLANSLRGMGTGAQEPLQDRLAGMTVPALIMAGELDAKFTELGRQLASAMPNARFAGIPGAGHAAQLEAPALCARLSAEFLAEVTA